MSQKHAATLRILMLWSFITLNIADHFH